MASSMIPRSQSADPLRNAIGILPNVGFPNPHDPPTETLELSVDDAVTLSIAVDLRNPVLSVPTGR